MCMRLYVCMRLIPVHVCVCVYDCMCVDKTCVDKRVMSSHVCALMCVNVCVYVCMRLYASYSISCVCMCV